MDNQETARRWLSEGLLLAAIPVVAHSIAFLYELGYCQFFGIPTFFISISTTAIFVAAGALLSIAWPIYSIFNAGSMIFTLGNTPLSRSLIRISSVALPLLGLLFLFGLDWAEWYTSAILLLYIILLELGIPVLAQRGKGSFSEKLRHQEEFESLQKKPHLYGVFSRVGTNWATIFLILSYALFLAYFCGRAVAKKQEIFLVFKAIPNVAVFRIYDDNLVAAAFDVKSNRLTGDFVFRKVGDAPGGSLTLKKIGRLSPKTEF